MGNVNVGTNTIEGERACSYLWTFLEMYRVNQKNFLDRYVTIDEMYVHRYDPQTKM